jgi:DNA adenine methylase
VEAFGGAASVLLQKPRSYAEVYNDLDETLIQLFRVLRDAEAASELVRLLELTPFARSEFESAYQPSDDPIESARRTIVRSFMGFGSDSTAGHYRTGFRCNVTRQGTTPARDWAGYPDQLRLLLERLQGVTIENRPALEVLQRFDGEETLHYVDPPYLPETRSQGNRRRCGPGTAAWAVYRHELTHADHVELLAKLRELRGMVILSGYPSPLYDRTLKDWLRVERKAYADGAAVRREVLWLNGAAVAAMPAPHLFGEVA